MIDKECDECGSRIDSDGYYREDDLDLAALSCVLAAEVIRLREENEELTKLRFDHH